MTTDLGQLHLLRKATKRHSAALFYGEIADLLWKGSAEYIEAQGTITFIRYRNRCFGITNHHVYDAATSRTAVWHIALNSHQPFLTKPLFTSTKEKPDYPFDIAVYELDEGLIRRGGKIPHDLGCDAVLAQGDHLLAVGFPGCERKILDEQTSIQHGLYYVVASAAGLSDRNIELYEELSDVKATIWHVGGMSGGPIFQVTSETSYTLAGIIYEAQKHPRPNTIYIRGFPFGPTQLELGFRIHGLSW